MCTLRSKAAPPETNGALKEVPEPARVGAEWIGGNNGLPGRSHPDNVLAIVGKGRFACPHPKSRRCPSPGCSEPPDKPIRLYRRCPPKRRKSPPHGLHSSSSVPTPLNRRRNRNSC